MARSCLVLRFGCHEDYGDSGCISILKAELCFALNTGFQHEGDVGKTEYRPKLAALTHGVQNEFSEILPVNALIVLLKFIKNWVV